MIRVSRAVVFKYRMSAGGAQSGTQVPTAYSEFLLAMDLDNFSVYSGSRGHTVKPSEFTNQSAWRIARFRVVSDKNTIDITKLKR